MSTTKQTGPWAVSDMFRVGPQPVQSLDNFGMQVGDIINFPKHAESEVEIRPASVLYTQGVPGNFRVTSINPDGSIGLEKVRD